MKLNIETCIGFFIAFLTAAIALGLNYPKEFSVGSAHGYTSKIHPDRWVEDGAEISLPSLASFGNKLVLNWNSWQDFDKRLVELSVCGLHSQEVLILPGKSSVIDLTGTCQPRLVKFNFKGSHSPNVNDQRVLGAQLESFKATSVLQLPILNWSKILSLGFLISVLIFLLKLLLPSLSPIVQAIFLMGTSCVLLESLEFTNWLLYFWLIILLIVVLTGACLGTVHKDLDLVGFGTSKYLNSILLLAILILSSFIRLYGLDFGLPHIYHPDEFQKYKAVMRMVEYGDLNPRYFWHPSLLLYSTYGMNTLWQYLFETNNFAETLIYSGRLVSCIAGILSVGLVYLIGKNLFNSRAGLWAGICLAFAPLHVTSSRYLKEDALLTFWILGCIYLVIKASQKKSLLILMLAGLLAGLTAGVKYSGAVSFLILWTYPWLVDRTKVFNPKSYLYPLLATLIVPIGFVITTPYSILDQATFMQDFNHEREHMLTGHSSMITASSQLWLFHIKNSIIPGLGWVLSILAMLGVGYLLSKDLTIGIFLLSIFLLYYMPAEFVRAKPAPQPERYIFPCLPILILFIVGMCEQIPKLLFRRILFLALAVGVAINSYRSITLAVEIKPDTRDTLSAWMLENIPAGSKVIIDWMQYGPQFISQSNLPFTVEYLDPEIAIEELSLGRLKQKNAQYLILSSLHYDRYFEMPNSSPAFRQVIRNIFTKYKIVKEVNSRYGSYGFHNPRLVVFELR